MEIKSIDETVDVDDVTEGIVFIEKEIEKQPFLVKRYFKRNLRQRYQELHKNWYHLVYDCLLEANNCAYEKTLDYTRKGAGLLRYLKG